MLFCLNSGSSGREERGGANEMKLFVLEREKRLFGSIFDQQLSVCRPGGLPRRRRRRRRGRGRSVALRHPLEAAGHV